MPDEPSHKPPHNPNADSPADLATLSDEAFARLGHTLLQRARRGHVPAFVQLGHWLASGRMDNVNPAEALTHLGAIYAEGLGVKKDAAEAVRLLTAAMAAGSHSAAEYLQGLEMRSGD